MPLIRKRVNREETERLSVYLGIDPGGSGGLAAINHYFTGSKVSDFTIQMPETRREVWEWFQYWRDNWSVGGHPIARFFAVIEKVGGYVAKSKDGESGGQQPGSSMFKFGDSFGSLCMALTAAEIPYEEITPQTWQKGLGIPVRAKGQETSYQFKKRLRAHAQRLFPSVKVRAETADAILIAEYCRRRCEGLLEVGKGKRAV